MICPFTACVLLSGYQEAHGKLDCKEVELIILKLFIHLKSTQWHLHLSGYTHLHDELTNPLSLTFFQQFVLVLDGMTQQHAGNHKQALLKLYTLTPLSGSTLALTERKRM